MADELGATPHGSFGGTFGDCSSSLSNTLLISLWVGRYRRMMGDDVYFTTGTDEHGVNILRVAEGKGVTPQQQADSVVERYHDLWKQLDISHNDFIRTTEERHHQAVAEMVRRIEHVELETTPDFFDIFVEGCMFKPMQLPVAE